MTDKQKIKILIEENKHLTDENNRLQKINVEFNHDEIEEIRNNLSDIYDALAKKYKQLCYLQHMRFWIIFKYKIMYYTHEVRKLLHI